MDELPGRKPVEPKAIRFGCAVLCAGFFLALLPFAGNYIAHHPDERHYTDGAIKMLKDGQWLSPRGADDSYRFRKPILAYWAVAGGIALLGFHALGARIVFLLAASGVVYLTYRIALLIYRDRRSALLAGAIIAANVQVLMAAARSIPDGLLSFFMTLSILGFTGILVDRGSKRRWYWAAYLGAGLALASKGGLALVVVGYFFVVALATHGRRGPRLLLHLPSLLSGYNLNNIN